MTGASWSDRYIGIPFRRLGRDRAGCDCWGLARLIWAERAGIAVPCHGTVYPETLTGPAQARGIVRTLAESTGRRAGGSAGGSGNAQWIAVSEGSERPLDAILMSGVALDEAGRLVRLAMHVAVVVTPGLLIHTEQGVDATTGRYRTDRALSRRVLGFWRHRELADG